MPGEIKYPGSDVTFAYLKKLRKVPPLLAHMIRAIFLTAKALKGEPYLERLQAAQKITFAQLLKYGYLKNYGGRILLTWKGIKRNQYHWREGSFKDYQLWMIITAAENRLRMLHRAKELELMGSVPGLR